MNDITIDKTGWKKWRFDEFAQNISERVEPSQTDMDVYVGLEHIDPDTLHLSRHGHPSDVEGTKLRFYKGDIIFGRRRAYQRKTALATTDGICSAHAMVLRAKEDVVDPSFFPFLFHSKQFIDMAITISVGGLSPTINWKDISKQEFLLPPKSEQKRLAELLWAADEMIEKEKKVVIKAQENLYLILSKNIGFCQNGNYITKIHEHIKVSNVLSKNKFNVGKLDTKDYQDNGMYPIIDQSKNEIAGYSEDELKKRFNALYTAFQYGAPPHAGMAPGVDRMVMLIAGEESIREIIPFPMNKTAMDVMMGAPSEVDPKQLADVHIKIDLPKEEK